MDLIKEANKKKQACIESIEHWQKDIVDRFEDNIIIENFGNSFVCEQTKEFIDENEYFWYNGKTNGVVKIGPKECSLCIISKGYCVYCPWRLYSNESCFADGQEYYNFVECPSIEGALAVIEKLWNIGINYK